MNNVKLHPRYQFCRALNVIREAKSGEELPTITNMKRSDLDYFVSHLEQLGVSVIGIGEQDGRYNLKLVKR